MRYGNCCLFAPAQISKSAISGLVWKELDLRNTLLKFGLLALICW